MASAPERIIDAQRALFTSSQTIGRKGLEGAAQLLELNMQASRALLAGGTLPWPGLLAATSICGGGRPDSAAPPAEAIAAYLPRMMEIVSNTGGEISRLLLQQASDMQALCNEMLAESLRLVPRGGEGPWAAGETPIAAMQRAFGRGGSAPATSSAPEQPIAPSARAGKQPLQSEE